VTKRHRTFTSAAPTQTDPVTFDLNGHVFTCKAALPGAVLLDFVAEADSGDGGRAAAVLVTFIETALIPDDVDQFRFVVRDAETAIPVETIGEIASYLVEEYAGRPTTPPDSSGATRTKSGRGSTAGSSRKG